jgi:hypothetical protein
VTVPNFAFAYAKAAQVFEREINPADCVVRTHVLPEIRQLQRRASVVRKFLAFRIAIPAEIEHLMPNWICRKPAISQQVPKCFVARDRLILTESS